MQWQQDLTLTSLLTLKLLLPPFPQGTGRLCPHPATIQSCPGSLCSGCWMAAEWPKSQDGMYRRLVLPSTHPVCTCLLLVSGDRLDQDWWFLLGVVGTAPGETKGVWGKTTPWHRWVGGAHFCHPSTQKAEAGGWGV